MSRERKVEGSEAHPPALRMMCAVPGGRPCGFLCFVNYWTTLSLGMRRFECLGTGFRRDGRRRRGWTDECGGGIDARVHAGHDGQFARGREGEGAVGEGGGVGGVGGGEVLLVRSGHCGWGLRLGVLWW